MSNQLAIHTFNDTPIQQRSLDGYMDATACCKATGKQFHDYRRLQSTQDFLNVLNAETGIPLTELINTLQGIHVVQQGTWVHPLVAINLAQWCSPQFAVFVSKLVMQWMQTGAKPTKKLRTPKVLTPAEQHLKQLRLTHRLIRTQMAQELFDATLAVQAEYEATQIAAPQPQLAAPIPLTVIQHLFKHERSVGSPANEILFGKLATKLSKELGRPIGSAPDRRFKNADGSWKTIHTYDEDVLEMVYQKHFATSGVH